MTTKSRTFTVQYIDTGRFGHFLPGPVVERFERQAKLVTALKDAAESLAEYRITRPEMAAKLMVALTFVPTEYQAVAVPPSMDRRLGFTKYGVLNRIAQDIAGTGPISGHIEILQNIVRELDSGLSFFLIGAEPAPNADTERANQLAAHAEEISKRHRATKGVYA
jgi:hypothetical protein